LRLERLNASCSKSAYGVGDSGTLCVTEFLFVLP
jgi:hypothetical protein